MKSKFSIFIDSVIISLTSGILFSLWVYKFSKNAIITNILLILYVILSFMGIYKMFCKQNNKAAFKKNNDKFIKDCLNYLIVCPYNEYKDYIIKLLKCEHLKDFLFKLNNTLININLKTGLTEIDYFTTQELFLKDKNLNKNIYFIYKSKSKSFDDICNLSPLNLIFYECSFLTKLMTEKNIFPITNNPPKEKISTKQKIQKFIKHNSQGITNKHFKEIFFSGISLLFLSLVVPFSKYYLVVGSTLIIISLITLIKRNHKNNPVDLDNIFH